MLNRVRFFGKTLGIVVALAVCSAIAEPIPIGSKSEVRAAKEQIDDLVATGVGAEKLLSMAGETKKGPERYWLYANAFIIQAKEGKYAEAKGTLDALRESVTDIPEVNIIYLIEKGAGREAAESPELAEMLKESRARLAAQKIIKNPKRVVFKASIGEAWAVCGDWNAALNAFAETGDAVSGIAKAELAQKQSAKIAAFWWDYRPCRELVSSMAFKAHAAEIYKKLLDAGKLSFVQKTLAEKRISQMSGMATTENEQSAPRRLEKMEQEMAPEKVILIPTAEQGGVECRYTFQEPIGDWKSLKFDDSRWRKGRTSFGDCYNATYWNTGDVWIRYAFDCNYDNKNIESAIFRCIVDDDIEVWLNGKEIFTRQGVVKQYMDWPLPGIMDCLRRGKNILVVHAHDVQNGNHPRGWGEFVDFGITLTVIGSNSRRDQKTTFHRERKVAEPSKEDELSALKKICDTKGLVHCWRFNGDLKDCVGGGEARCCGNAKVDDQQVSIFGGPGGESGSSVVLGSELIPNEGSSITIELWATQHNVEWYSRIFHFGDVSGSTIFMTWSRKMDVNQCQINVWDSVNRYNVVGVPENFGFAPFDLGAEYHIAMVFECCSGQSWKMKVYKQDAKTGETLKKVSLGIQEGWSLRGFATPQCYLGRGTRESAANASYNEVRIWNRALDEKELTQNAIKFHKAGETVKTSGGPRRYVGRGNSLSGRETRQQPKLTPEELQKIIDAENAYDKKMFERKFGKDGQR